MGYLLGKRYQKLPKKLVLKCTSNKEYWTHAERRSDVQNIDVTKGYGKSEVESGKK